MRIFAQLPAPARRRKTGPRTGRSGGHIPPSAPARAQAAPPRSPGPGPVPPPRFPRPVPAAPAAAAPPQPAAAPVLAAPAAAVPALRPFGNGSSASRLVLGARPRGSRPCRRGPRSGPRRGPRLAPAGPVFSAGPFAPAAPPAPAASPVPVALRPGLLLRSGARGVRPGRQEGGLQAAPGSPGPW